MSMHPQPIPAIPEETIRIAHAVLGDRTTVDWLAWANDYDLIRDGIAKVIPGCQDYNDLPTSVLAQAPGQFDQRVVVGVGAGLLRVFGR